MSRLVQCGTCDHAMAQNAEACPKCGSPNEWVHPKITKFIDTDGEELIPSAWNYEFKRDELTLVVSKTTFMFKVAMTLIVLSALLFFVVGGASIWVALVGVIIFSVGKNNNEKVIEIKIGDDKSTWTSNDDGYWKAVIEYFNEAEEAA